MATRQKYTVQDQILAILQTHTQKEAARLLNVSTRTIRRWKNEGVTPTAQNAKTLSTQSKKERRKLKQKGSYDIDVPVKTKKIKDTTIYDASRILLKHQFDLLKQMRKHGQSKHLSLVRFVIRIPKGGTSPGGREFKLGGYYSTSYYNIADYSDSELYELLLEHNRHGSIHDIVQVGKKEK